MVESGLERQLRRPSLADALVPLVVLAVPIAGALALFGLDALDGPIQVALGVTGLRIEKTEPTTVEEKS